MGIALQLIFLHTAQTYNIMKLLRIFRPGNLFIILLTQLIVRYVIIQYFYENIAITLQQSSVSFALLVGATIFIAAAGNMVNDLADVNIDKINKPKKITIDKIIERPIALRIYTMMTALGVSMGIASAIIINCWYLGLIFPIIAYILFNYSMVYKKIPFVGNLTVAFLSGFVPLVVWLFEISTMFNALIIDAYSLTVIKTMSYFVFGLSFFAFTTTLIREVFKDIEDIEGDEAYGVKSLPMLLGLGKIRILQFALLIITLGMLSYIQHVLFINGFTYLCMILFITNILIFIASVLTLKMRNRMAASRLSFIMKNIMLLGILSMLFI